MINRIQAVSHQGSYLNLLLEDLENGFLLEEVGGLDPVKATITSSGFANLDGSQYQSSRREERNITLKISLEPDYSANETVRDLRRRLYTYFMTKQAVQLRFISDDMETVWIDGRVESFETELFSAEPQVNISIICFNPDFYNPSAIYVPGNTTEAMTPMTLDYAGDVESGILFRIFPNRALTSFSIYFETPDGESTQMDFNGALEADDTLFISTTPGNKYVNLSRDGVSTSFLYGITPQSDWLSLQPGENFVRVYSEGAPIPYSIGYTNKFGGL